MVVIFAGCDGTGKSTCFDLLKHIVLGTYIKESYTASLEEKKNRINILRDHLKDDFVVYDRATAIDDFIYDPIIKGTESLLVDMKDEIKDVLKQCLIIYFDCEDETLTYRLGSRGDDYVTKDHIASIKSTYDKFFKDMDLQYETIDTTKSSPEEVYLDVLGILEKYLED